MATTRKVSKASQKRAESMKKLKLVHTPSGRRHVRIDSGNGKSSSTKSRAGLTKEFEAQGFGTSQASQLARAKERGDTSTVTRLKSDFAKHKAQEVATKELKAQRGGGVSTTKVRATKTRAEQITTTQTQKPVTETQREVAHRESVRKWREGEQLSSADLLRLQGSGSGGGRTVTVSTFTVPKLLQDVTIQGKVYDNVTQEEALANKLSSNSKATLDIQSTLTRDEEVVKDQTRTEIRNKTSRAEPLTTQEKYFLLTGDTKPSTESLNKFIEKSGSSSQNVKTTQGNIENLYNYDTQAQAYQEQKKELEAAKNAPPQTYTTTKNYSENWGVRTSEKWAERLVSKEQKIANERANIREAYGLTGLDPKEGDNAAVATLKALGNIASAWTVELPTTTQSIVLVGDKAGFSLFSGGVAATTSDLGYTKNVAGSIKEQAIGGADAITPIKIDSLIKGDGVKYDPQGTANIIFASAVANVQTGLKLRDPRIKTTGKVESKDIQVKGKIEVTGRTTGKPNPTGSKQTLTLKFQEKTTGLLKKKIDTTIERTPTGTIIKTQNIGPKSYVRTTQVKGSNAALVEKVINGKLTRTYVAKGSGLKSEFTQYESIVKVKTNTAYQPTDSVIAQTGYKQTIQNIKGRVSETQTAKGPLKVTTKAETFSQAGQGARVTSGTSAKGLTLKEFEVTQGKLGIGKAPAKANLETSNLGNTVTATVKPKVDTAYSYTTDITGNLKVSNLPTKGSFLKSTRGSLGPDPVLLNRDLVIINEISTPTVNAAFTLPRVANSVSGGPTLTPIIDLSSFAPARATGKDKVEIKPNSDLINQPTLNLTPISNLDISQSNRLDTRGSQSLGQSKGLRKDSVSIQQPDVIQQPQLEDIEQIQPATKNPRLALNFSFQYPKAEIPPILVPTPAFKPFTPKQGSQKGFNVITKKGGKDLLLTSNPLLESEALAFGSSIVGSSARASFRLEKASGPLGSFSGKGLLGDFYKSKSGSYVEKREKRLDTIGELKEITFSPLNTKDKKKKGKKKKASPFAFKGGFF